MASAHRVNPQHRLFRVLHGDCVVINVNESLELTGEGRRKKVLYYHPFCYTQIARLTGLIRPKCLISVLSHGLAGCESAKIGAGRSLGGHNPTMPANSGTERSAETAGTEERGVSRAA